MSTFLFLLLLIGVALLIPTAYAGKIGAPWAPTRRRAIESAFSRLGIDQKDVVVDLGAGDAKVLLAAHARGAKAIGYELSPIMWIVAAVRTIGKKGIRIVYRNFYKAKLPDNTTVIFVFLMPENMPRLRQYLRKQSLPHLVYIASYAFGFKDVVPAYTVHEKNCAPVHIYSAEDVFTQR